MLCSSEPLSAKIDDYNLDNNIIESHPLNEGFILPVDNHKNSPPITSTSDNSTVAKHTSTSYDISSTTCKTITVLKTINPTSAIGDDGEINSFLKIDDKELVNTEVTIDGSGETTEPTSETTTTTTSNEPITTSLTSISSSTSTLITSTISITNSTTAPAEIVLSGNSTFLISVDCTNASNILTDILEQFNKTFPYSYYVTYSEIPDQCPKSSDFPVSMTFFTNNNVTILTTLFQTLENIVSKMRIELRSVNICGDNGIVTVTDITSCYLIDLCNLCGTNPIRGVCLPELNVSKCECFVNQNDPTISYVGEFCNIQIQQPITPTSSSSWLPIIIGILAGLTGLFLLITIYLLIMIFVRRHSQKKNISQVNHLWSLPRAQIPTSVSAQNIYNYLTNTISTSSSNQTNSNYNRSYPTDSIFFQKLDRKMGENLRATITRPNTQAMLASLPTDIISIESSYDPINELDAIIDNEDISMIFHEPINLDNKRFEILNPNFRLSRLKTSV